MDFVNAVFSLLQAFLTALQNLFNSLFDAIARLFGG